jgi:CspA family cold shock protein
MGAIGLNRKDDALPRGRLRPGRSIQGAVRRLGQRSRRAFTPDGGGKDLFAHFSEIQSTGGFRSLAEGQKVEFEVKQGQKGPQASTIKAI